MYQEVSTKELGTPQKGGYTHSHHHTQISSCHTRTMHVHATTVRSGTVSHASQRTKPRTVEGLHPTTHTTTVKASESRRTTTAGTWQSSSITGLFKGGSLVTRCSRVSELASLGRTLASREEVP